MYDSSEIILSSNFCVLLHIKWIWYGSDSVFLIYKMHLAFNEILVIILFHISCCPSAHKGIKQAEPDSTTSLSCEDYMS